MKFLHLADLHLGKRLNDVDLLKDQEYALKQILSKTDSYDAILIAGDVYDKADPKAEAMTLFDSFVTELVRKEKKVFIIAGNHDSDQRISYFSSLLASNNIYFSRKFEGVLQTISLEDEYGELDIHLSGLFTSKGSIPKKASRLMRMRYALSLRNPILIRPRETSCWLISSSLVLKDRILKSMQLVVLIMLMQRSLMILIMLP